MTMVIDWFQMARCLIINALYWLSAELRAVVTVFMTDASTSNILSLLPQYMIALQPVVPMILKFN